MPLSPEFVPWMTSEVNEWADKYACHARRAFPAWALNFIFDVEEDDTFNQTDTLTQGDAGLDGWYYDVEGGVVHLVQAKYLDDPTNGTVSPDPEVPARARPTRRLPAAYKARILEEYDRLGKAEKGALLRREGLYSSLLSEWRNQRDRGGMAELARPCRPPSAS
ncbi:MAG: hypothetical protein ACYDAD_12220 [Acidimicrobiales bacterium]